MNEQYLQPSKNKWISNSLERQWVKFLTTVSWAVLQLNIPVELILVPAIFRISQLSKKIVANGNHKGEDNRLITKHYYEIREEKEQRAGP